MASEFDFIVVGGGSAGAVVAARLSEDPDCTVVLVEAGDRPPEIELMPIACADLQNDPETDWMLTADAGRAGLGLRDRRMPVPRGKMLGGCSSINYMAYVRGHPGDFDAWAEHGADGWSFEEVLPYFRKSEALEASDEIVIDDDAHGWDGPMGVSVRSPVLPASRDFVAAAAAIGIPEGDYNGRDRGGPRGVASLFQTTTRKGKRTSTYRAFLEDAADQRPNLRLLTNAQVTKVIVESIDGELTATGVELVEGEQGLRRIRASREVVLSAGAVGSPHLLMLSGIGPREELEAVGVDCILDLPGVGKHLKDHLYYTLPFPAPGLGVSDHDIAVACGADSLRGPDGPLPVDPQEDEALSPRLRSLKTKADRAYKDWQTSGAGLAASSMYEATAFYSTGLGDHHSHDAQIALFVAAGSEEELRSLSRTEAKDFYSHPEEACAPETEWLLLLAYLALPHSEGEIVLSSSDPAVPPEILMNYYSDPHDIEVMASVIRRTLELAENWPGPGELGPVDLPPELVERYGHRAGQPLSDSLLEAMALHYSMTVYHLSCTCRIGDVVDPDLQVQGIRNLSVADASIMPEIVSGNTNAAAIMIGEKAAELVALRHGVRLTEFVGC